jgi:hypothetical protein
MMSSSPWAKLLRLVPGTGMKPGSGPPLLMSNAKTVRMRASGAAVPRGAAAAAPAVPTATASAALLMIAARPVHVETSSGPVLLTVTRPRRRAGADRGQPWSGSGLAPIRGWWLAR